MKFKVLTLLVFLVITDVAALDETATTGKKWPDLILSDGREYGAYAGENGTIWYKSIGNETVTWDFKILRVLRRHGFKNVILDDIRITAVIGDTPVYTASFGTLEGINGCTYHSILFSLPINARESKARLLKQMSDDRCRNSESSRTLARNLSDKELLILGITAHGRKVRVALDLLKPGARRSINLFRRSLNSNCVHSVVYTPSIKVTGREIDARYLCYLESNGLSQMISLKGILNEEDRFINSSFSITEVAYDDPAQFSE